MSRLPERPNIWRIDRRENDRIKFVGVINASSKDAAIKRACEKFGIDPEHERELIVREM